MTTIDKEHRIILRPTHPIMKFDGVCYFLIYRLHRFLQCYKRHGKEIAWNHRPACLASLLSNLMLRRESNPL